MVSVLVDVKDIFIIESLNILPLKQQFLFMLYT